MAHAVMGAGASSRGWGRRRPEAAAAFQRNLQLSIQIKADDARERSIAKLLLLGTGDSGKSTIMKQVRIIHDSGFSKEEIENFWPLVYQNVFSSMSALLDAMESFGIGLESEGNRSHAATVRALVADMHVNISKMYKPSAEHREALEQLWADSGVKKCYERRNEYQIQDSAGYFFQHLDRIFSPSYVLPTNEDILQIRVRTTGVIEVPFQVKYKHRSLAFKMIDVGGQRSERRKWIHCFDNVTAVLFVVALSEYNQVLLEDGVTSRLCESLKLFESIINNPFFVKAGFILFLNKEDLFDQKIREFPLAKYVDEYKGPEGDASSAKKYLAGRYLRCDRRKRKGNGSSSDNRDLYSHFTCATDTKQIAKVFDDVVDIITKMSMEATGLL